MTHQDDELREKALGILSNMPLYWDAVQTAYKVAYSSRDIVPVTPEQKKQLDEAVTSLSNGLAALIHDREAKAERRGERKAAEFYRGTLTEHDLRELDKTTLQTWNIYESDLAQSEQEGSEV